MAIKSRKKKVLLILVAVLVALIMVIPTFGQVLGREEKDKKEKKDMIGFVECQGDLVNYNLDGVQIVEVTDEDERAPILNMAQNDPDFKLLLTEVANKDAEVSGGTIDTEIVSLSLTGTYQDPTSSHNNITITVSVVSFDNKNLPKGTTGGEKGISKIEMVSLSLTSKNGNDIQLNYAKGAKADEKIVHGAVVTLTEKGQGVIGENGLQHQVYHIHSILIVNHRPVYYYLWWYDSHHHPNWFYGYYFWHWKYYWYYHYNWYPWYTWYWGGWYYWRYWNYWSTYWPYYRPYYIDY